MGCWGSALYENDSTCDVRDGYLEFLNDGLSNDEAYEKTLEQFHDYLGDQDYEPLFWFALAETQWKMGRLRPDVKGKAIEWIEKNGGIELWEDDIKGIEAWQKTLIKLKDKLEQPMPKEKKIRKAPVIINNPWNLYDIYAYQLHGKIASEKKISGKYILLQKIGEGEHEQEGVCMRIQVFDHVFDEMPSLDDVKGLRQLPLDTPRVSARGHEILLDRYIFMDKNIRYPAKHLTFLGNRPCVPSKMECEEWALYWGNLEYIFINFYFVWKELTYEITKEGRGYYKNPKGKLEGYGLGFLCYDEIVEVRETYVSALCKGLNSQTAFEKTVEKLGQGYLGERQEPLFWYALADVQWDLSRLLPEVHSKALEWIEKSGGLDICGDNQYRRADWEEALENLKFKLKEPTQWPCPLLKLRQQQKISCNRWKTNDIYAYQFHGEEARKTGLFGKYILIQKIGAKESSVGAMLFMLIHVLDCVFDQLPTLVDIEQLRILPLKLILPNEVPKHFRLKELNYVGVICMNQTLLIHQEEDYPAAYLTYIGNRQGPANRQHFSLSSASFDAGWGDIDDRLVKCYQFWQRKEYETVEEGIYRLTHL